MVPPSGLREFLASQRTDACFQVEVSQIHGFRGVAPLSVTKRDQPSPPEPHSARPRSLDQRKGPLLSGRSFGAATSLRPDYELGDVQNRRPQRCRPTLRNSLRVLECGVKLAKRRFLTAQHWILVLLRPSNQESQVELGVGGLSWNAFQKHDLGVDSFTSLLISRLTRSVR
jgi:hypothetical protein